jgi:hypothetical protein
MKSLFRNIRMKLLNEGKLVRYLTYAIGEVLLIIVGIMIALQLNNWNEDRKAQQEFDLFLIQLKEDVRTAIDDTMEVAAYNAERATRGLKAIKLLEDSEFETEDITALEDGIHALGVYHEPHIDIGFLGQLMNGEMGIINRDRVLALRAMKMQSEVHKSLGPMIHIKNQSNYSGAQDCGSSG